jgi:hypothetical protein
MRSAQQLKNMGVPTWYHAHARQYIRLFENVGWSDAQIDQAIKFGVNYRGDSEADLTRQFRDFAATIEAPELDLTIDAGLGVRDTIMSDGVEALPALPSTDSNFTSDDAARLAAIRQEIRNDPSALDRLQDEQLALLEAQQAAGGKVSANPTDSPARPSGDRLAQIREMRRNDPDAYNYDHALQQEELGLIEASLPPTAPISTAHESAPTNNETE